jgi:hypothetical protein
VTGEIRKVRGGEFPNGMAGRLQGAASRIPPRRSPGKFRPADEVQGPMEIPMPDYLGFSRGGASVGAANPRS